jgi:hypothetical protein
MADYKRDFETEEQYRQRIADPLTVETDIGKVLDDEVPSPWIVDQGPVWNSRRDERAIRRENQRIFELDERDRLPR